MQMLISTFSMLNTIGHQGNAIKATVRYHCITVIVAKMRKTYITKFSRECGASGTLNLC